MTKCCGEPWGTPCPNEAPRGYRLCDECVARRYDRIRPDFPSEVALRDGDHRAVQEVAK